MNYKTSEIVSILNNQVMKNALGESTTIAEDLSNIVEVGKAVASMTATDLKEFKRQLVVGANNVVINRLYNAKTFDILKDEIAYGGALQRIMASGLLTAQESHLLNLVNGQSYLDGKFYGVNVDAKIYMDTKAYKIVHSISDDDFSQRFMDASGVREFIGLILTTVENTVSIQLAELTKRIVVMAVVKAYDGGRFIPLLTEFNAKLGRGDSAKPDYTMADINSDRHLKAYFSDFCKATISKIEDYMKDINKKYNDATVVTFTPADKLKLVMINDFASDIKFIGDPVDFNKVDMPTYETINAWQNPTDEMLPSLEDATYIKVADASVEGGYKEYENVVAVLFDKDSMGITIKRERKTTIEYVGSEGFTNYHTHMANNYFIDTRLGVVVFTLD